MNCLCQRTVFVQGGWCPTCGRALRTIYEVTPPVIDSRALRSAYAVAWSVGVFVVVCLVSLIVGK